MHVDGAQNRVHHKTVTCRIDRPDRPTLLHRPCARHDEGDQPDDAVLMALWSMLSPLGRYESADFAVESAGGVRYRRSDRSPTPGVKADPHWGVACTREQVWC